MRKVDSVAIILILLAMVMPWPHLWRAGLPDFVCLLVVFLPTSVRHPVVLMVLGLMLDVLLKLPFGVSSIKLLLVSALVEVFRVRRQHDMVGNVIKFAAVVFIAQLPLHILALSNGGGMPSKLIIISILTTAVISVYSLPNTTAKI